MLPLCTAGQFPYAVANDYTAGLAGGTGFPANTAAATCHNFVVNYSGSGVRFNDASEHLCRYTQSGVTYSNAIIKSCDPVHELTSEKIADMSLLWGSFLLAAILIWCARGMLNVFRNGPHGE